MVQITDLKKSYGSRFTLDIPELNVDDGGRYAIIGANGSGKSTLLKILAGVMDPDGGNIIISNDDQRNRGYMPQKNYIFGFSVLKNVTIALYDKENAHENAMDALRILGMESFSGVRGSGLSGGEAQRTAIARMIAQPRKLLLLDEPTSATDIAGNDLVEAAILRFTEKTGCSLIFATHSPAQAERMADRVIMLHCGKIVENGPAGEVLHHPKSEEGEKFLCHWKLKE